MVKSPWLLFHSGMENLLNWTSLRSSHNCFPALQDDLCSGRPRYWTQVTFCSSAAPGNPPSSSWSLIKKAEGWYKTCRSFPRQNMKTLGSMAASRMLFTAMNYPEDKLWVLPLDIQWAVAAVPALHAQEQRMDQAVSPHRITTPPGTSTRCDQLSTTSGSIFRLVPPPPACAWWWHTFPSPKSDPCAGGRQAKGHTYYCHPTSWMNTLRCFRSPLAFHLARPFCWLTGKTRASK